MGRTWIDDNGETSSSDEEQASRQHPGSDIATQWLDEPRPGGTEIFCFLTVSWL